MNYFSFLLRCFHYNDGKETRFIQESRITVIEWRTNMIWPILRSSQWNRFSHKGFQSERNWLCLTFPFVLWGFSTRIFIKDIAIYFKIATDRKFILKCHQRNWPQNKCLNCLNIDLVILSFPTNCWNQ